MIESTNAMTIMLRDFAFNALSPLSISMIQLFAMLSTVAFRLDATWAIGLFALGVVVLYLVELGRPDRLRNVLASSIFILKF